MSPDWIPHYLQNINIGIRCLEGPMKRSYNSVYFKLPIGPSASKNNEDLQQYSGCTRDIVKG